MGEPTTERNEERITSIEQDFIELKAGIDHKIDSVKESMSKMLGVMFWKTMGMALTCLGIVITLILGGTRFLDRQISELKDSVVRHEDRGHTKTAQILGSHTADINYNKDMIHRVDDRVRKIREYPLYNEPKRTT